MKMLTQTKKYANAEKAYNAYLVPIEPKVEEKLESSKKTPIKEKIRGIDGHPELHLAIDPKLYQDFGGQVPSQGYNNLPKAFPKLHAFECTSGTDIDRGKNIDTPGKKNVESAQAS